MHTNYTSWYCRSWWILYIFIILYNIIIGFPLWNIICGIIVWVPTITVSLETVTYLDMNLIVTLVINNIWPFRWAFSRSTTFSTDMVLEVHFSQSIFDILLNFHSVLLQEWSLVLMIIFDGRRLSPLWADKVVVLIFSLFQKGIHIVWIHVSFNVISIMNDWALEPQGI